MNETKLSRWCRDATWRIRYGPDRAEVYQELMDHLRDHRDALMEQGVSEEDAAAQAVEAMGSPEEIALELAAIHKPYWGYVYNAAKCLLVVGLLALVLVSLWQGHRFLTDDIYKAPDYSKASFNPYTETASNRQILYEEPGNELRGSYYIATLSKVACWDQPGGSFHFQLNVKSNLPLCDFPEFCYYFAARDNLGNEYFCRNLSRPMASSGRIITGKIYQTSPFSWIYDASIPNFDPTGVQWIEIYYDRDGRSMVVRFDLPGGDTQ